jgi:hypothetical protein
MKTSYSCSLVTIIILCTNGIQAQSTQPKLNQMELMKEFMGIWKGEIAKDTVMIMNFTSYGKAVENSYKIIVKDKILYSGKEIYGYNQKYDKIILAAFVIILHRSVLWHAGTVQRTQGILSVINIFLVLKSPLIKYNGF